MKWLRGTGLNEEISNTTTKILKFEEYRAICTAFAYLQNRITAIENHIGLVTNDPQPGLHILDDKWLIFGPSPYPMEDVY
jgi:hypothetical protein